MQRGRERREGGGGKTGDRHLRNMYVHYVIVFIIEKLGGEALRILSDGMFYPEKRCHTATRT